MQRVVVFQVRHIRRSKQTYKVEVVTAGGRATAKVEGRLGIEGEAMCSVYNVCKTDKTGNTLATAVFRKVEKITMSHVAKRHLCGA